MNNEEKQKRGRIIPIAHQERRSILFYSLIFFFYGFFIDFKPSEPFLVPYLIKEKNFTNHEIEDRIFPLWTYAYFVAVVLCGLMSEVIQYKPLIVIGSLARVATRVILIVGTSLIAMQATQFTFGLASGTEVIFYAYIYYLVPYSQYQKLTGVTRASVLVGHVGANLLGQLLVTRFHSPLIVLFYISLGAICIATGISVFFPSVTIELKSCSQNFQGMKGAFLDLVANRDALPWTLWLIFSSFTNDLVLNYATTLFEEVDPSKDWNGLVMAIVRLSGALGAVLPAIHYIDGRMEKSRRIVVTGITLLAGVAMILTAFSNIYVVYALFVYYMGAITFGTSVACAQIAKSMSTRKFALVFSVITIVYLGIETLVQFIIGAQALDLDSRIMFIVFGSILIVNAFIFTGINILAYRSRVHKDYAALSSSPSSSSTYVDQRPLASFASPDPAIN